MWHANLTSLVLQRFSFSRRQSASTHDAFAEIRWSTTLSIACCTPQISLTFAESPPQTSPTHRVIRVVNP